MPEEANHLGVRSRADKRHVAISEGAIDLEMKAWFGWWVSLLSEGFHAISRQIEVEAVGADFRSGHLSYERKT